MEQGRHKRMFLEILDELLGVLEEEGAVTKTRLSNRANLNPTSFQRYYQLILDSGAALLRREPGRHVLVATPRASLLRALVRVLGDAVRVERSVIERYMEMLSIVAEALRRLGWRGLRGGAVDSPRGLLCLDLLAEGDCRVGVILAPRGDPLNYARLWSISLLAAGDKPQGIDDVLVIAEDEAVAAAARKAGLVVVAPVSSEDIGKALRGVCG